MGNWFCRVKKMRVVISGLDGTGKTSILYQMKLGEVVQTIPTIGFNVEILHVDRVEITCWDIGGRDKARALWQHYLPGTQGFIFMIDSTDRERLPEALEDLVRYVIYEEQTLGSVVMVVANKQDVEGALPVQEIENIVQKKCGGINTHTVFVVPCCALDGNQVTEAFSYFAHQMCLNEAGQAKRGFISMKERQSQMNESSKSSQKLVLKNFLSNSIEHIKTHFQ